MSRDTQGLAAARALSRSGYSGDAPRSVCTTGGHDIKECRAQQDVRTLTRKHELRAWDLSSKNQRAEGKFSIVPKFTSGNSARFLVLTQ